jgi:hypothetical protein
MADMDAALDRYQEIETGEAFSLQGPRLAHRNRPRSHSWDCVTLTGLGWRFRSSSKAGALAVPSMTYIV